MTCSPPRGTGRSSAGASGRTTTTGCSLASARRASRRRHTPGTSISASTPRSCTRASAWASSVRWPGSAASPTSGRRSRSRARSTSCGRERLALLHLVPQRVQLLQARPSDHESALVREPLQRLEPPAELVVRPRERALGIDAELARQVHDREQQIAEFGFNRLRFPAVVRESFRVSRFPFELRGLFLHLRDRPTPLGPAETPPVSRRVA